MPQAHYGGSYDRAAAHGVRRHMAEVRSLPRPDSPGRNKPDREALARERRLAREESELIRKQRRNLVSRALPDAQREWYHR